MRLSLAFGIVLALAAPPADACSRRHHPTDEQLFDEATHVFVARVVSTQLKRLRGRECEVGDLDDDDCEYVEARYELAESLKGSPGRRGKVRDLVFGPGNCSLGLLAGIYYVFYLDSDHNWVPHINGSFPLGPFYEDREREAVQRIREYPHQRPGDNA